MKKLIYILIMVVVPMMAQKGWTPGAAQKWLTGTSAGSIYYTGGFVGIGTTNPLYTFTVAGNIYGNRGYWGSGTLTAPSITFDIENSMGFYRPSTGSAVFVGGNLGIGGTPAYTLDVTGKGRFTDSLRALAFVTTSDTTLKTNMHCITEWDMTQFKDVHPITYNFKPEIFAQYDSLGNVTNQEYVDQMTAATQNGFKAQEFGALIKKQEGQKNLTTMDLIIALWLKNQELEKRIEVLENK